jgi:hypothetical protein
VVFSISVVCIRFSFAKEEIRKSGSILLQMNWKVEKDTFLISASLALADDEISHRNPRICSFDYCTAYFLDDLEKIYKMFVFISEEDIKISWLIER